MNIKKLELILEIDGISTVFRVPNNRELMDKINEIIDVVNELNK